MGRLVVAIAALLIGCDAPENMITLSHVEGAYHWNYAPTDEPAIEFERGSTVFEDSEQVPQCCMGIYRRTDESFEIALGNEVTPPVAGPCAPVGELRLYIDGVAAAAPQTVELTADSTRAVIWYRQPREGSCTRFLQQHDSEDAVEVHVTGQLKLRALHCLAPPDGSGWPCPLVADGNWAVESDDGMLRANGSFLVDDQYVPLEL